jgi:hypothetical protein
MTYKKNRQLFSTHQTIRRVQYLAVCALRHCLVCLKLPNLHSRSAAQDVGGLPHELRALDLGAGSDDLALSDPLALGGHRQRVLELPREDDVLDEHALDVHAPALGHVPNDLGDALSNLLAALDNVLQHARADHVSQRGLGAFDQGLAHVRDAEGGLVWGDDVVVDDGREVNGDIVLGHAHLLWHLADLNLDVDLDEFFGEGVDLDQARVDGAVEAAELGDQADVALADGLVGVGTHDAARDGTEESHAGAEDIDEAAVDAIAGIVVADSQVLRVRGLQLAVFDRLDLDQRRVGGVGARGRGRVRGNGTGGTGRDLGVGSVGGHCEDWAGNWGMRGGGHAALKYESEGGGQVGANTARQIGCGPGDRWELGPYPNRPEEATGVLEERLVLLCCRAVVISWLVVPIIPILRIRVCDHGVRGGTAMADDRHYTRLRYITRLTCPGAGCYARPRNPRPAPRGCANDLVLHLAAPHRFGNS